ncbi:31054_t:CDS:2 [Gigaspora margarita]|uniref:31054_t:CDS:1 n=1 Tax=Gigaspora margarita TaxID=4874 RepID=A0ABM8VYC1_GIGMA|nr:31054_t:CDS:2 [Gigaspora margarita]
MNKRIQTIHIMAYNEDIPPEYRELFLNLISAQTELKELELNYFSTSSFTPLLRQKMLQTKSQSLRKLILQGIKFDKDNLTNIAPNLEILSIKYSFGNPFEDNEIELNRIMLNSKCESLKFFRIKERVLSNEVKEEFILLLSQNCPNMTTLCYITDNLIFSLILKIFKKLCQLQIGGFAYYDLLYSNQDYLQALVRYLPSSLKVLNLLNVYDYSHENLDRFLQNFDIERVKLEVFILPFNIEFDLLPNLRKFIEKAKNLRYIEFVRSENCDVEKQKDSEKKIIDLCHLNSILKICIKKYSQNKKKDDEEIFLILLKLADLGLYPEAEYFLSLLYINKQGITEGDTALNLEYAKQFNKWLQQAAEKEHAKAKELYYKIKD